MGSELYAYFSVDAEGLESAELQELAQDAGTAEVPGASEGQVSARLDAASPVRQGEDAELWLHATKLQFFDPETGKNLAVSH